MRNYIVAITVLFIMLISVTSAEMAARNSSSPLSFNIQSEFVSKQSILLTGISKTDLNVAQNVALIDQIGGSVYDVFIQGNQAYVGIGPNLTILDISNNTQPTKVGNILFPGLVKQVVLQGNYAYVYYRGHTSSSIGIVDVSDPTVPLIIGYIEGYLSDFVVADKYIYIVNKDGLTVIDVSDPAAPTETNFYSLPYLNSIAILGNYIYVTSNSELRVFDRSNPAVPQEIGVYETINGSNIVISGYYAYIISGDGLPLFLRVVDLTNPILPMEVGALDISSGIPGDIVVANGYVYITKWGWDGIGLRVVDVSNPVAPVVIGHSTELDAPHGIALYIAAQGGQRTIFVADEGSGLSIIDVTDPTIPIEITKYNSFAKWHRVATSDNYLYVLCGDSQQYGYNPDILRAIDVSNPIMPVEIGSINTFGTQLASAKDIEIKGNHVYLADISLRVIDVSDPTVMEYVGFVFTDRDPHSLALEDDFVYSADYDKGLSVIDISDPTTPELVGFYVTQDHAIDVAVAEEYAYVIDNSYGLRIIDVSNPENPFEISFLDTPDLETDVTVAGNYAYVVGNDLHVIDVSNPKNPFEVGIYDFPGEGGGVAIVDEYIYTISMQATQDTGLRVIDVSNPMEPVEVGYYYLERPINLAVSGNIVYVVDWEMGLYTLEYLPYRFYLPNIWRP